MKGFFDMEEMPEGSEVPELPGQLAFFPDQCTTHPEGKKQKRTYPELNPLVLNDPHLVSILICCVLLRLLIIRFTILSYVKMSLCIFCIEIKK